MHYKGEMYKIEVIRYYESQGYSLVKSSTYESILEDLIMEKEGNPQIRIEVKDSKSSIFSKTQTLKKEIFLYFLNWVQLGEENKFIMHIFISELTKHEETKRVITKSAEKDLLLKWFNDRDKMDLNEEVQNKLNQVNYDQIHEFFSNISIKICPGYVLSQRNEEFAKRFCSPLQTRAKTLLNELNNRKLPKNKRSKIYLNYLDIEYPKTYFELFSNFKLAKTVYQKAEKKFPDVDLPCMMIPRFESSVSKIRSFDPNLEIFFEFSPNRNIFKMDFQRLDEQRQRELLNRHLNHYFYVKGLRRNNRDFYFAYDEPIDNKDGEVAPIMCKSYTNNDKKVTVPRYKDNELNFVEHKSFEANLEKFDDNWVILLWPSLIFTYDGVNRIEGEHASRIQAKYLKPEWNRNSNKRSEIRFWTNFLSNDSFKRKKECWFDEFLIKKPEEYSIDWSSETIDLNQNSLAKWGVIN